ncbi:MAG: SixA phosphatase family protein [Gammaproteobacteria bacterium]
MPCELLLLRHAKSDWTQNGSDFDRPLNPRGERDAARIGRWLRHQAALPDSLLCSPARRAAQTAHAVCALGGIALDGIRWDERLYLASVGTLCQVIGELPDGCHRALVVGHNPGLEDLLLQLVPTALSYRKDHKLLTTATLAWLDLAGSWSAPEKASLREFVRARDLGDV